MERKSFRKLYAGLALLLVATVAIASDKAQNAYKTHKVNNNTLLFQCNDEREPVIRKFENTTLVMVSCQEVALPAGK